MRQLAFAITMAVLAAPVAAQPYPERTVKLIVPFGAGGITDLVARSVAEQLGKELGQSLVIENRTGANGNIAAEFVARSAPDGYTLLMSTLAMFSVNPVIYKQLAYSPERDLEPIALAASTPHVFVVNPSVKATDLPAFVGLARQQPGSLSFGTAGIGSSPHQTAILLEAMTGAKLLDVHYRSGLASVTAVLQGELTMTAEATPVLVEHAKAGTLRALAVAAPHRVALLPGVPTTAEAGYAGLENGSVSGLVGPRGLPAPVKARLVQAVAAALAAPGLQDRLTAQGTAPLAGSGEDFQRLIDRDLARWRPLLQHVTVQ